MIHHRPSHWVAVALVVAAALFTLREVHGQSTGAQAVFEGRPAMAGAQAGLGAMSGPPQGGIGLQGTEGSRLGLRRPADLDVPRAMPQGEFDIDERLGAREPATERAARLGDARETRRNVARL